MLANIHEFFNCCHSYYFLLSNLSKILHVAFLLLVSIRLLDPTKWKINYAKGLIILTLFILGKLMKGWGIK